MSTPLHGQQYNSAYYAKKSFNTDYIICLIHNVCKLTGPFPRRYFLVPLYLQLPNRCVFSVCPLYKCKAVHLNEGGLNAPFIALHFALVFAFNIDSLLFKKRY